jgi:hypothetical protein
MLYRNFKKYSTSEIFNVVQNVIREEIRRIKERDPSISHKQAFGTASKNVKHSSAQSSKLFLPT